MLAQSKELLLLFSIAWAVSLGALGHYMGYRKRTGFLAGLTVAQISEFSLILGVLGVSLGHINPDVLGVITLVGLITISASTYMILYSQGLYQKLLPLLGILEIKRPNWEMLPGQQSISESFDIIVFGLGRFGRTLVNVFMLKGYSVLAIDFDPEAVRWAKLMGMKARYGDAEDEEFIAMLPLHNTKWVVGAMHDKYISQTLSQHLHEIGYSGKSAFTVHDKYNVDKITRHGAVLIMIHEYAAQHAAQQLIKLDAL